MTWLTAFLAAAGAVFGGLNMLYASFASRTRELATLQAVGFSRPGIFISLVQESLLATLTGTVLASFIAVLMVDSLVVNFSMGSFHLTLSGTTTAVSLLTGILLGLVGSVPPALRCLSMPLPTALRS
jgi:ABC-type antimicrobial peptide transport system permease subunit